MTTTDMQKAFIEQYVENGGNAAKAYRAAGYAGDSGNANRLVRKLAGEINEALRNRMVSSSGKILKRLEAIIMDSETAPRDVINAAANWLDRSGLPRASQVAVDQRVQTEERPLLKQISEKGKIIYEVTPGFWLPAKDGDDNEGQDRNWDMSHPATRDYVASLN